MDKYFLEFLNELSFCLKKYNANFWANWMEKSAKEFIEQKDLYKFFSAFGGSGSYNDCIDGRDTDLESVLHVLVDVAYVIANDIKSNKSNDIMSYLLGRQEMSKKRLESRYAVDGDKKDLAYVNYLIENYNYSNLHEIDEIYFDKVNEKSKTK